MDTATDRRASGATRIPFDALVEVGGALGPTFEAQARDLSRDGMHLEAAYLPEIGQPLSCRFESGSSHVICEGEVTWKHEAARGGEFGIRFTNLDSESEAALQTLLQENEMGEAKMACEPGTKIRLHIDGLGAPMRARIKDADESMLTAYSELAFLKIGKELSMEEAGTGARRTARIDQVDVEVHPESKIPQLVVSLSYGEGLLHPAEPMRSKAGNEMNRRGSKPQMAEAGEGEHSESAQDGEDVQAHGPNRMQNAKDLVAKGFSKVTPAIAGIGSKAKGLGMAIFSKVAPASKTKEEAPPIRRTTAPAPAGGLHMNGRKIVRSEGNEMLLEKRESGGALGLMKTHKRKIAVATAAALALGLFVAASRKSETPIATTTPVAASIDSVQPAASSPLAAAKPSPLPSSAPLAAVSPNAAVDNSHGMFPGDPSEGAEAADGKPEKLVPFGHGTVGAGNVLHLKMDGRITSMQGAAQPTGFTVVLPHRRGVEPAAALLKKDSRIAEVHLNNQPSGAEVSITFKDGVPAYIVRAKGDTLEMVLAKPDGKAEAKNTTAKPSSGHALQPAAHHTHSHKH